MFAVCQVCAQLEMCLCGSGAASSNVCACVHDGEQVSACSFLFVLAVHYPSLMLVCFFFNVRATRCAVVFRGHDLMMTMMMIMIHAYTCSTPSDFHVNIGTSCKKQNKESNKSLKSESIGRLNCAAGLFLVLNSFMLVSILVTTKPAWFLK